MEKFKVRPKLRIGVNGQMTFLGGPRDKIEQSYRRSMGITMEDERERMMEIIEPRMWLQTEMREGGVRYRVVFGASLDEWMLDVNVDGGLSFSDEWVRSRGVKFKE